MNTVKKVAAILAVALACLGSLPPTNAADNTEGNQLVAKGRVDTVHVYGDDVVFAVNGVEYAIPAKSLISLPSSEGTKATELKAGDYISVAPEPGQGPHRPIRTYEVEILRR